MRESSGLKKSYGNIWRYFYDKDGERFLDEVVNLKEEGFINRANK